MSADKDFIRFFQNDRGIGERSIAFSPQEAREERTPSGQVRKLPPDIEILDNGDVAVRYFGNETDSVSIVIGSEEPVSLEHLESGMFETVIRFDVSISGPHPLQYIVNGREVLNAYAPIWYSRSRAYNYLEIPDEEVAEAISIRNVPHGTIAQDIFWSESIGDYLRCYVYLPPGYEKGTREYPCLYLQNGGTENETCWVYNGKAAYIMDNLIADGKAEPFIIVMNDGMVSNERDKSRFDYYGFEGVVTKDSREFIEGRYRVRKDKWGRAMAGLSRGSMQTIIIGMHYPELYGYLGCFSGCLRRMNSPASDYEESDYLAPLRNPEQFKQDFRVFFRSSGDAEPRYGEFLEDDAFVSKYGIDRMEGYVRKVYPYMLHEWGAWRRALIDFAQVIFR